MLSNAAQQCFQCIMSERRSQSQLYKPVSCRLLRSSGECHAVREGRFRGLPALFCPASLIGSESAPISLPDLLQSKARAAQQRHV